jgi:hypothetical protein
MSNHDPFFFFSCYFAPERYMKFTYLSVKQLCTSILFLLTWLLT